MELKMKDEELILAKIAIGDQQSFSKLFKFYKNKVYGYALSLLQSEALSQEIIQEVFIKIWLKREELSEIKNFGAYLRVITRNHTLNALKKIATEQKNYTLSIVGKTEIDRNTEDGIQYRETKLILEQAIEKLPAQQKIVYNLCHNEGLKQKDVALKLNISPLTVKVHLREAVKSIRNYLHTHSEIKASVLLLILLNK